LTASRAAAHVDGKPTPGTLPTVGDRRSEASGASKIGEKASVLNQ
jgi:hypothetical protein